MDTDRKINRRDALKYMGTICAGAFLVSSGVLAMPGCTAERRVKRLVFYFTATGNCLYVARQIAGETGELRSIPQEINKSNRLYEAEEIGFVFPTYAHIPPAMVQDFLTGSTFKADYLFAVATYGAFHGGIMEVWDKLAKSKGYHFNYLNTVLMVDNAINFFDMDQERAIDKHIPKQMAKMLEGINSRQDYRQPVTDQDRKMHADYMRMSRLDPVKPCLGRAEKYVAVVGNCISCGICRSVCPHGSWKIEDRAIPEGVCEGCMACIHNCPQKAITLQPSPTMPDYPTDRNPKARYRNPHVTIPDIIRANNQTK